MTTPIAPDAPMRTIHPQALVEAGPDLCIALLDVARRLKSGEIPPESYDQTEWEQRCGTGCCILGHAAITMGHSVYMLLGRLGGSLRLPKALGQLFGVGPTRRTPAMAANAIEAYIFSHAQDPWRAS